MASYTMVFTLDSAIIKYFQNLRVAELRMGVKNYWGYKPDA